MYKRTGKIMASLLSVSMIWGNLAFAASPATSAEGSSANKSAIVISDTANHWAKDTIDRWSARGIVNGVSTGKFEPDRSVTRSEWVSMLNRIFQLQSDKQTAFKDVSADKWFATDVSTAVYGGYIQGFSDGTFKPEAPLSRAEAAVSISKLLKLSAATTEVAFKDQQSIKDWSKAAIDKVVEHGIITGYSNHTFQPEQALTRAEAIAIADRAVNYYGEWYGEAGTYGPAKGVEQVKGNVIINAPGVTLQNTEISGDLIIGKGVGSGDVYLKNINVKGQVNIYGGGDHSIHLQDSIVVKVIVDKKDGSVRLVAEGNSSIQEVTINTGATLDVSKGVSVNRVTLTESLPKDSTVSLKGYFNTVNVEAYSISLKIPEGSIKELNVSDQAADSTIDTSKEATILSMVLNAAAKVIGLGSIQNSTVNAQGVSFQNKPDNLTVGSKAPTDLKVSIGGAPAATVSPQATPVPAVGGGSSGGDSSPQVTPTPSPTTPTTPLSRNIKVEKKYVSVGEAVYFTSDYDYDVYLVSNRISSGRATLDLAVESGEGQLLHVKAGERNYFDTSLFTGVGYPYNYQFYMFGYSGDLLYSVVQLKFLNENEVLKARPSVITTMIDPEYFSFEYNRIILLNEGQSVESIIQFREVGGEYQPFTSAQGTVVVDGNVITIKPVAGFMKQGKSYDIKLVADAITTTNGEKNTQYESLNHKTITKLRMVSPVLSGWGYQIKIKAGDILTFTVTDPDTVYFLPDSISGTQSDFDRKVADQWGKKLVVDASMVNQPLQLDTSSLSPGTYKLQAWWGTVYYFIIE